MITKVNTTVLDLDTTISKSGRFENLSVENDPVDDTGVGNKKWLSENYVGTIGDSMLSSATLTFMDSLPPTQSLVLNANKGDVALGPSIRMWSDGHIHTEGDMYIGSKNNAIHFVFGSEVAAQADEAFCIHSDQIVSHIGALVLRSPNVTGSPDPSPYILLESLAPGEPQALGGSLSPAIVMSNPDAPAQSYPYQYTKISNRDGTILQVEGDNAFSDGQPVSTGTPLFAIMQNAGVYLDLFGHVLKRVGDPVDPEDGVNKRYVDEFSGSVTTSSSYGPTGYAVFHGGLTMQWGIAPEAPEGAATVTLPIAWNTGFMVGFCAAEVSGGDTKVGSVVAHGTSQVTITYNKSGSPVTPSAGSWIAFGY